MRTHKTQIVTFDTHTQKRAQNERNAIYAQFLGFFFRGRDQRKDQQKTQLPYSRDF